MEGPAGVHERVHEDDHRHHSMLTATLVARNVPAGREESHPWLVDEDAEYHEAGDRGRRGSVSGLRQVAAHRKAAGLLAAWPRRLASDPLASAKRVTRLLLTRRS